VSYGSFGDSVRRAILDEALAELIIQKDDSEPQEQEPASQMQLASRVNRERSAAVKQIFATSTQPTECGYIYIFEPDGIEAVLIDP
jgi:hypothetical protein